MMRGANQSDRHEDDVAYRRREQPVLARIDYRTELDLSGRNLSYLPNHHLASTYLALQALNISNNAITRLEGLPQTLTSLDASHNLLKSVSGLEECISITTLVLDHNGLTSLGRGLESCTNLTELSVAGNELRNLSGLECCFALSRIDASHNHIASVEALRTLSINTKLVWMALRGNPCASTVSFRLKLCGLLPHLLLLDNAKMPKTNYRPSSPMHTPSRAAPSPGGRPETPRQNDSAHHDAPLGPWNAFNVPASQSASGYTVESYARRHSPSPMRGRSPKCAGPTQASLAREKEQQRKQAIKLLMSDNRAHGIGNRHEAHHQRSARLTAAEHEHQHTKPSPPKAQRRLQPEPEQEYPTRSPDLSPPTASPHDKSAADASLERRSRGARTAKGLVVKGLHEQTEKLYQCHVLEMGVITKQQQQLNDLRRELKIVKSAVTYINMKLPASSPSKQSSSAQPDDSTDAVLEETRETFEQLVSAREALVKAMHFADAAQRGEANREYLEFRRQLVESGMLPALPAPREDQPASRADKHASGNERVVPEGRARRADAHKDGRGRQGDKADQEGGQVGRDKLSAAQLHERRDAPREANPAWSAQGRSKLEERPAAVRSHTGASNEDRDGTPPNDDATSVDKPDAHVAEKPNTHNAPQHAASAKASGGGGGRGRGAGGGREDQDAGAAQSALATKAAGGAPARPELGTPAPPVSSSREEQQQQQQQQDLSESMQLSLQDCEDEVADEHTTVGLALRNVVKLARMEDCEAGKIEEYRRLLEDCGVLEEFEPAPEIAQLRDSEAEEAVPAGRVRDVLASIARLNTAKTALRKMMGLLASNPPGAGVVVRYAGVIESSLLS